jgi:hypothetical protein
VTVAKLPRARVELCEIEDDRQRFYDRRLALLGEAKLPLDAQPLGIGAQVRVEQRLFLPGLALDLLGHGEQVDEHRHLGLEHDRIDRLEHIVHRAHRIAAQQMLALLVHRGEEDDRHALGLLARADDLRGLIAVDAGHIDIYQDHRELAPKELAQRFLARIGDDDVGDVLEYRTDREQIALVIVDDEHPGAILDGFGVGHERGLGDPGISGRGKLRAHPQFGSATIAPAARDASRARAIHTRSSASSRSMSTGLAI